MILRVAKYFGIGLLDVVCPRNCLVRDTPLDESEFDFISDAGFSDLRIIAARNACAKCGIFIPAREFAPEDEICGECRDREIDLQFGRSRSVVLLNDAARPLVYSLKYWKHPAVARDMARLAKKCPGFLEHLAGAVLVPVPICRKRMRARGYNQSRHLADELAKISAGARVEEFLERVRDTGTQTALDAESRRKNVEGAFAISRHKRLDPFARYVLVDDVFTTGSTLNECARALRDAGALSVDAATFAHG